MSLFFQQMNFQTSKANSNVVEHFSYVEKSEWLLIKIEGGFWFICVKYTSDNWHESVFVVNFYVNVWMLFDL